MKDHSQHRHSEGRRRAQDRKYRSQKRIRMIGTVLSCLAVLLIGLVI